MRCFVSFFSHLFRPEVVARLEEGFASFGTQDPKTQQSRPGGGPPFSIIIEIATSATIPKITTITTAHTATEVQKPAMPAA